VNRRMLAAAAASATIGVAAWWLTDSAPYPCTQRRLLDLPFPFLTNARLDAVLGARPGERMLEVGPGTGLQSLHVASSSMPLTWSRPWGRSPIREQPPLAYLARLQPGHMSDEKSR
jgi:hypothetical protein